MTLDGLEQILQEKVPTGPALAKGKNKQSQPGAILRMTSLSLGSPKRSGATEVKPLVSAFLRARGLELSPEKTTITHIEDGFDFLGQHVRKYNGQFLTRPSKKNVNAFLKDIRETIIKDNKQAPTAYGLIAHSTPKYRDGQTITDMARPAKPLSM